MEIMPSKTKAEFAADNPYGRRKQSSQSSVIQSSQAQLHTARAGIVFLRDAGERTTPGAGRKNN